MPFHAKDLRRGRFSKSGHLYLITTVTRDRKKSFKNFYAARILINTLRAADEKRISSTIGFVVMPDHLHWLMTLDGGLDMSKIVGFVKGQSAYRINQSIKNGNFSWQAGFHDHALRQYEDVEAAMRYVIANPLRAGLVKEIGKYPHWDCIYL